MPGFRVNRSAEDIHRELTDIMRSLKDPRVTSTMLSIIRVDLTNDFSVCKVYVSSMDGFDKAKTAVQGLKSASGFIRRELSLRLHLRHTPELRFIADDSIEYSAGISKKLASLDFGKEDDLDNDNNDDQD